jgi:hypothetical protein
MQHGTALWASLPTLLLALWTASGLGALVDRRYGPALIFLSGIALYSVLCSAAFILLFQTRIGRGLLLPASYIATGILLGNDVGIVGAGIGAFLATAIWLGLARSLKATMQH